MASPMVDGRVEPHRKATYTLDVSDQIRREDRTGSRYSGVKYNHKPALSSGTRTSSIKLADNNTYRLSLRDTDNAGNKDMFVFNGSRTASSKSYVLLFDQTTQKATLERLDSNYTFNLSTKNGTDVSSDHGKIYPKKAHKDSVHDREEGEVELFGDEPGEEANEGTQPDASNPYDFRHFLNAVKAKKDTAEDRGYASSPDYRNTNNTNNAPSAANTPVLTTRRAVEPTKKRKAASVFAKKPAAKGASAPKKPAAPAIPLDRRATSTSKPPAAAPSSSKIKSAEFIQSSDESDADADAAFSLPNTQQPRRSRSPSHRHDDDNSDAEGEDGSGDDGLEIQVPDAQAHSRRHNSHLNPTTSHHQRAARSPSNGPISLASAATSVAGTPRRGVAAEEIDFGELGGEEEDAEGEVDDEEEDDDVERMDLGTPAAGRAGLDGRKSVSAGGGGGAASGGGGGAGASGGAAASAGAEVDEDELYMEMMEGLAGGDSSEESEEE